MRVIAAILAAIALIGAGGIGLLDIRLWGDEPFEGGIDPPSLQLSFLGVATDRAPAELSEDGTACERLAGVTTDLGRGEPSPDEFLRALGLAAAGIRPPPRALADLAAGGRDRIPGGGFRPTYSDGTAGQARHFAGVAVATLYGGTAATKVASIFLRRDPARSADGRLSERALEFASLVSSGELPIEQAGPWILINVCRPAGLVPSGPDEG